MENKELNKLKIILNKEKDGRWSISEKRTGVSTYGKTKLEAVTRFCEALELWYETKKDLAKGK